jgi:ribosomal RNA-processing protein 8
MGKRNKGKFRQHPDTRKPIEKSTNSSQGTTTHTPGAQALEGSRFRWLNESLYTEDSQKSFQLFQGDPSLFEAYHRGFRSQAANWPSNPVQDICSFAKSKLTHGSSIGDFGCGDAQIAQNLNKTMTVHSFDLVSVNPLVTACNIAKVPLGDASLDMAVFSLALMGIDWPKFIHEASRCLKLGGILYIAEVQSRVADFDLFCKSFLTSFEIISAENIREKYFVKLILKKKSNKMPVINSELLKPCLYKRR